MGPATLAVPKAKVDILIIFIVFFYVSFPIPAWKYRGLWLGNQFIAASG